MSLYIERHDGSSLSAIFSSEGCWATTTIGAKIATAADKEIFIRQIYQIIAAQIGMVLDAMLFGIWPSLGFVRPTSCLVQIICPYGQIICTPKIELRWEKT